MFSLKKSQANVHIVVRPHDIAGSGFDLLVVKSQGANKKYQLEGFWSDAESTLAVGLSDVVKSYGLTRQHCTMVLPHSAYSHFTLNKPNIPHQEIRQSLPWIAQDRLEAMSFHSPIMDACLASPVLKGKEHNKMHVFVAEDSHVRSSVENVSKAGLQVDAVTVHELAISAFLREWSENALLGYLDVQPNQSSTMVMVLHGDFVAYKNLPGINLQAAADVQQEQFSLFWSEVSRHFQHYNACLDSTPPFMFYLTGKLAKSLSANQAFKRSFREKLHQKKTFSGVDLTQVIEPAGVDDVVWELIHHDLVGGVLLHG